MHVFYKGVVDLSVTLVDWTAFNLACRLPYSRGIQSELFLTLNDCIDKYVQNMSQI